GGAGVIIDQSIDGACAVTLNAPTMPAAQPITANGNLSPSALFVSGVMSSAGHEHEPAGAGGAPVPLPSLFGSLFGSFGAYGSSLGFVVTVTAGAGSPSGTGAKRVPTFGSVETTSPGPSRPSTRGSPCVSCAIEHENPAAVSRSQ